MSSHGFCGTGVQACFSQALWIRVSHKIAAKVSVGQSCVPSERSVGGGSASKLPPVVVVRIQVLTSCQTKGHHALLAIGWRPPSASCHMIDLKYPLSFLSVSLSQLLHYSHNKRSVVFISHHPGISGYCGKYLRSLVMFFAISQLLFHLYLIC